MLSLRDREEIAKNHRELISAKRFVGPATCCTLLELWLTRKIELSEDDFDHLVGALHDHLEKAYDDRYRLIKSPPKDYDGDDDGDTDTDVPF